MIITSITRSHRSGPFWKCNICPYKTLVKRYLLRHFGTHYKKFSCETCQQKFSTSKDFKRHQQKHRHGFYATELFKGFECNTCDRSFLTELGLYNHISNHTNRSIFHCDICGKTFRGKETFRVHLQSHLKVFCPICKHLLAKHRLKQHVDLHSSTAAFPCNACGKKFPTHNHLYNHTQVLHKVEKCQCDFCNRIFRNKTVIARSNSSPNSVLNVWKSDSQFLHETSYEIISSIWEMVSGLQNIKMSAKILKYKREEQASKDAPRNTSLQVLEMRI